MKAFFRTVPFLLIILFVSISACQKDDDRAMSDDKRLRVITTILPLYSFTKNVAEDLAVVENLLPSGAGPHEYSFKPRDIKKVADSQILIINGLGLEKWMDNLIRSVGDDGLTVVNTSIGVEAVNNDPHIWMSPKNAIIQVNNITDALIKADPDNAEAYIRNSAGYINRLMLLDGDISRAAAGWGSKEYVAYHPSLLYFARDYGLRQVAVIQESPEKGPTPKHLTDIMDKIREAGIEAIFSEPGPQPRSVNMIARELDIKVYRIDTMETGELSADWYEEKMRANLLVMEMAFDKYYNASGKKQ